MLVGSRVCTSNSKLMNLINSTDVGNRVSLLAERSDIARITAGFDIAACTSSSEGFPNIVAEAMSCGVPCVATDVGDVRRLLGDTGMIVPPRSPELLSAAWHELATSSKEVRHALGVRARNRIKKHFSLDLVTHQYENVYASLVSPDHQSN